MGIWGVVHVPPASPLTLMLLEGVSRLATNFTNCALFCHTICHFNNYSRVHWREFISSRWSKASSGLRYDFQQQYNSTAMVTGAFSIDDNREHNPE